MARSPSLDLSGSPTGNIRPRGGNRQQRSQDDRLPACSSAPDEGHPAGAHRRDVGFCAWAVRDQWSKAAPLLEHARPGYLALSLATVAVYYLVFILGWIRILATWNIDISYRVALQSEMVSMLAKYLPGGVWTPAARTYALRRYAGVTDTPAVLASILVEAGLSAISGVIVFVVSLAWVRGVNAPLLPLLAFASAARARVAPARLPAARGAAAATVRGRVDRAACRSRRRSRC